MTSNCLSNKHILLSVLFLMISSIVMAQFPGAEVINDQHVRLMQPGRENEKAIREKFMDKEPASLSNQDIYAILKINYKTNHYWTEPYAIEIYNRILEMSPKEQYDAALNSFKYFRNWNKKDTCRQLIDLTCQRAYESEENEKIATAWYKKAIHYQFCTKDSVFSNLDKAIIYAKKTDNRCLKSCIYARKGVSYVQTGSFEKAENLLLLAADSLDECGDEDGMNNYRAKYLVGYNYFAWGKYQQALHWFERNLKEHEDDMYISDFWNIYEIMGNIYIALKEYDKAVEMHKIVLELRTFRGKYQDEDPASNKGIAFSLNNLAEIYLETGELDTALNYAQRSFIIKEHPESTASLYERSTSSYNISKAYLLLGNTDSAMYYNNITNEYISKSARLHYLFRALSQEAEILLAMGKTEEAVRVSNKSVEMALETSVVNDIKNTLLVHSKVMEATGFYKQALDSYKHYNIIRDSIISEKTKNEIASLKISHEADKNIQLITSQKEKLEISKQNNQLTIIIFSLIILLATISLLIIIRTRKKKIELLTKENQIIVMERAVIEKELEQKNSELICQIKNMVEKENLIKDLNRKVKKLRDFDKEHFCEYSDIINDISNHYAGNGWEEFEVHLQHTHPSFLDALRKAHPNLTNNEWRICILLRLNQTTKQIARIMHIAPASVDVARSRIRKNMNLDKSVNLVQYISGLS